MKIALLTDKFTTGGGLEHIYQLCAGMPDMEFGVFGADGEARDRFKGMQHVHQFFDTDTRTVDRFNADVVHYHHLRPLLKLTKPRARTVFTVHGVHLHKFEFQSGIKARVGRAARLTLEKMLYRRVDRFITVSDEDRDFLRKHYGTDSTTIFNGIDFTPIEAVRESKPTLRQRLNLPLEKHICLMVARFDFPKGHDILIRAIGELERQHAVGDRVFVFAGDGDLLPEIRALADALNVRQHVLFLGRRTDVYDLMAAADVLILPSRWEGLPLTLLEALVSRLPAIASQTYGISTVQRMTGDNVTLFDNENPVDLARALTLHSVFAPCNLDRFRLASMVDKTRKVYLGQ